MGAWSWADSLHPPPPSHALTATLSRPPTRCRRHRDVAPAHCSRACKPAHRADRGVARNAHAAASSDSSRRARTAQPPPRGGAARGGAAARRGAALRPDGAAWGGAWGGVWGGTSRRCPGGASPGGAWGGGGGGEELVVMEAGAR